MRPARAPRRHRAPRPSWFAVAAGWRRLAWPFAAVGGMAMLPAQIPFPWGTPAPTQQTQQTQQGQQPQLRRPYGLTASVTAGSPQPVFRPGFQGLQSVYPQYPGYPAYPPSMALKGLQASPSLALQFLPPLGKARERTWPSWIGSAADEAHRVQPDRALLVRSSDRVWYLAPGEDAFVPLAFHDKVRMLEPGAAVEVRHQGEFQVLFHDGALLRADGPVRFRVSRLDAELGEIELRDFRRVWIDVRVRPLRVLLPDDSLLQVQRSEIYVERRDDRGFVHNQGPQPVTLQGRVGRTEIPAAHALEMLFDRGHRPFLAPELRLEGAVSVERDGRVVTLRGQGDGAVSWSGARFQLGAAATVRLDPLAGVAFPEAQPARGVDP